MHNTDSLSLHIFSTSVEFKERKMVSKVEEALKRNKQQQQNQQQKQIQIQCNKGKAGKFKKSSSNLEEDGVSSAILLLACIACAPSYGLQS